MHSKDDQPQNGGDRHASDCREVSYLEFLTMESMLSDRANVKIVHDLEKSLALAMSSLELCTDAQPAANNAVLGAVMHPGRSSIRTSIASLLDAASANLQQVILKSADIIEHSMVLPQVQEVVMYSGSELREAPLEERYQAVLSRQKCFEARVAQYQALIELTNDAFRETREAVGQGNRLPERDRAALHLAHGMVIRSCLSQRTAFEEMIDDYRAMADSSCLLHDDLDVSFKILDQIESPAYRGNPSRTALESAYDGLNRHISCYTDPCRRTALMHQALVMHRADLALHDSLERLRRADRVPGLMEPFMYCGEYYRNYRNALKDGALHELARDAYHLIGGEPPPIADFALAALTEIQQRYRRESSFRHIF